MVLAEGAPVSVGIVESGMPPVSSVALSSSLPASPFSSESSTVTFPGFPALSGDASLHVAGDSLMSGNPLTDPGWVNYSPLMGDGMLPPGLALEQAMEVAAAAWETTNPSSGYSVIEEAEAIAASASEGFEEQVVQETTRITGESTLVLGEESADATVAANVVGLAQKLGLDSLAEGVAEDYGLVLALEDGSISSEMYQESGALVEDATRELTSFTEAPVPADDEQLSPDTLDGNLKGEADNQNEETREDIAETDEGIELKDEESEQEEQEDHKEEKQEDFPRPMVAYSTDGQRREVVIQAVRDEVAAAKKQQRNLSVSAIANTFGAKAAKSPIRVQLGLTGEEEGITVIAGNLRRQPITPSPVNVIAAGHAAIAQNSAVILASNGTEATKESIAAAIGSRRNPFS